MDLSKMQDMLSQATAMREQMEQRLAATIVEADSGGGAVTARMNGKKELLKLTIAPSAASAAAGDITMLEDLIVGTGGLHGPLGIHHKPRHPERSVTA